jgi:hypothetical protein
MEIHLDKRAVKLIRLSAQDAIEEGDTEALREDILEAFSEEQIEEIERRLDNGDFFEFLTDMLDEWSVDDVDELFELVETQLGEIGVDLKYDTKGVSADDDDDDADLDDDDDDDDDEEEEEEEEDPLLARPASRPRRPGGGFGGSDAPVEAAASLSPRRAESSDSRGRRWPSLAA